MRELRYAAQAERCSGSRSSDVEWLSALLTAAKPWLDNGYGYGVSVQRNTDQGAVEALTGFHKLTLEESLRDSQPWEVVSVQGHAAPHLCFVLWTSVAGRSQLSARARDALLRIRIYVETALRLRLLDATDAVALISPDGRIDQNEARSAWAALSAGRWSLAERIEPDGSHVYLVFENPPDAVPYRKLSETERAVVDLCSGGISSKHSAYALGIAESSVSRHLESAATRLGFCDRRALLRFAGRVARPLPAEAGHLRSITQAERCVLRLICQGKSNRAIAEARGASERTIANQVASLLRKAGATNRRELIVIADTAMEEMTMVQPLAAGQTAEPSE